MSALHIERVTRRPQLTSSSREEVGFYMVPALSTLSVMYRLGRNLHHLQHAMFTVFIEKQMLIGPPSGQLLAREPF